MLTSIAVTPALARRYAADGGVSPFYLWIGAVDAQPGTMLRHEPLDAAHSLEDASVSERILYASTDGVEGSARIAVSGTVYLPKTPRPANGWPTIVWAHGTVGVADICAPSWRGWLKRDRAYLNSWLRYGFAVVSSDYQGLGTPGMHPYLLWKPEAYGLLDAARAAQSTFELDRRAVVVGQSQGSGAALGAVYAARSYAPDVDLLGAVATGLVVSLATPVPGARQVAIPPYAGGGDVDAAYSMLYLLGLDQSTNGTLDVDRYVSAAGADLMKTGTTECLTQLFKVARNEHLDRSNAFTPARQSLIVAEDAAAAFPSAVLTLPIFTGTGLADVEAGTAEQYNFISDMCAVGTHVSWHYYPGLTHNGTVNASLVDSLPFVVAVMNGLTPPSNCDSLVEPGPIQQPLQNVIFND